MLVWDEDWGDDDFLGGLTIDLSKEFEKSECDHPDSPWLSETPIELIQCELVDNVEFSNGKKRQLSSSERKRVEKMRAEGLSSAPLGTIDLKLKFEPFTKESGRAQADLNGYRARRAAGR
jgi:hypothetical protein